VQALGDEKAPGVEDFRGRPLLLLFFNIGCPGCTGRAIPFSLQLREQFPDLQIVGIHARFEGPAYSPSQVRAVIEYLKVPYPVLLDEGHETFSRYAAGGTPHWVLLDADGHIVRSIFGSMAGSQQRLAYALLELYGEG